MMQDEVIFSFGMLVKDNQTPLQRIDFVTIGEIIKNGFHGIQEKTKILRQVVRISDDRYRYMKTQLPYLSCSTFMNNIRKYENFESACGWILDIDSKVALEADLAQKIKSDERIALSFTSPNGYGMKLFFLFDHPWRDKLNYSTAYKSFSQKFALDYGIMENIDLKNCDVSRVCFLCQDEKVLINPAYLCIDPLEYIFQPSLFLTEQKEIIQKNEDEGIPADIYKNILYRLGTKPKPTQSKPLVPDGLFQIIESITELLKEHDIEVVKKDEVQYGIKIEALHHNNRGEVIIYCGKKGYTVVSSARKGVHHALNEIMKQILENYLYTQNI